ncbi:squalene/phytoene synthase family protein [Streptomyces misionensis]|uniref:squalene/phytoene synthase family protein n=1 Tax=Streptomyces misionensis TaxID=67331 RepID=UPI0034182B46
MSRWPAVLSEAGITDQRLRGDYETQRRLVRHNRREEYLATRLLLPARLQPFVLSVVAFMDETDKRIDLGDPSVRQKALLSWDQEVRAALRGTDDPQNSTLRTLTDTSERFPQLVTRVCEFLDGAAVEAAWSGFESEADFQRYVDSYSLPALMLTACLVGPTQGEDQYEPFLRGCRKLIEAMQRTDFLADLREDLAQGHVGVPLDALRQQGLDVDGLRARPQETASAVQRLVAAQAGLAARTLAECTDLPSLVVQAHRPFLRALISVQELRLRAVESRGGALLEEGASPSVAAAARVLWREYQAARRIHRGHRLR